MSRFVRSCSRRAPAFTLMALGACAALLLLVVPAGTPEVAEAAKATLTPTSPSGPTVTPTPTTAPTVTPTPTTAPTPTTPPRGVPVWRFDIATFCWPCTPEDHFGQAQFDVLNWVDTAGNGHFLAMGSDAHRSEVTTNGNTLAVYYNTLNDGWTTMTGAQKADDIHTNWVLARFTATGPRPNWIILNEISAGTWPSNQSYRNWLVDVLQRLNQFYGYGVIVASPFANPGANGADWQRVATYSYIAIEQYLSGAEIRDAGFSVAWCESQYRTSKQKYATLGVPESRMFLIEHFGQTTDQLEDGTPVTWGRNNVSYADWDRALNTRHDAARNVGFRGFASFAWGKNAMLASDAELIHFEETYRAKPLP